MRRPALLIAILVALALPASSQAASCPLTNTQAGSMTHQQVLYVTWCLINTQRRAAGIPVLQRNTKLEQAANGHAADMIRRHYFSHTTPEGKTFLDRIRATGYFNGAHWWYAGENIAWGSGSRSTPNSIVAAWMNSTGHRANILSRNYKETGFGIVLGSPGGYSKSATFVEEFGARG